MAEIGKTNLLDVIRETENGVYLDGENLGEILMPRKFVTREVMESGRAKVFVYSDSQDRLVATTESPYAEAGEFAFLEVIETNRYGAFLDWGLPKHLLVPFSEQKLKMVEGRSYLVYIFSDSKTNRLAASAKIGKYLSALPPEYEMGDEVQLLIAEETESGYRAIVNGAHWGMLYKNQLVEPLAVGSKTSGFVNKVREDGKIDLLAVKPGYEKIDALSEKLLQTLKQNNGFLALTDKSSPEIVQVLLGMSKKNFKKAVGQLYKKRWIDFKSDGIALIHKK